MPKTITFKVISIVEVGLITFVDEKATETGLSVLRTGIASVDKDTFSPYFNTLKMIYLAWSMEQEKTVSSTHSWSKLARPPFYWLMKDRLMSSSIFTKPDSLHVMKRTSYVINIRDWPPAMMPKMNHIAKIANIPPSSLDTFSEVFRDVAHTEDCIGQRKVHDETHKAKLI